ncbi:hypothetical protein JXB27_01780 [Candidatus Woesearchaeota archaeon]|nr:hypothetical protein [Candidatus Woesearchaeota archaeon]
MEFLTGVIFIANFFLAIIAGLIAATLFEISKGKQIKPWKPLAWALIFFAIEEVIKTLRAFGLYENIWITHVIPSVIAMLLIYAVALQMLAVKEAEK